MIPNTIIVVCAKGELTHARLIGLLDGIVIQWGHYRETHFLPVDQEDIRATEHPEVIDIWDGRAWNIAELANLLTWCCPDQCDDRGQE